MSGRRACGGQNRLARCNELRTTYQKISCGTGFRASYRLTILLSVIYIERRSLKAWETDPARWLDDRPTVPTAGLDMSAPARWARGHARHRRPFTAPARSTRRRRDPKGWCRRLSANATALALVDLHEADIIYLYIYTTLSCFRTTTN